MYRALSTLFVSVQLGVDAAATATASDWQYHQTAACCQHLGDEDSLMTCLTSVEYGMKDIAIVSYASQSILDYATYAFGVNSAYAEQNGYELYFLNEANGFNYEPQVAR